MLFPTMAKQDDETGLWSVPIHGWLFNDERRTDRKRALLSLLRKSFKIHDEDREILRRRMGPFLVDNLRWRKIPIRINGEQTIRWMPRTPKNGHFHEELTLELDTLSTEKGSISVKVPLDAGDRRTFESKVHLVPSTGLSVISDIDDTIKLSEVGVKSALLKNTFLKEFEAVPGMAKLYQSLKSKHDCTFHYVSSSPWQLFEELEDFRKASGFPEATFHLKSIRLKDRTVFNFAADPFKTKTATITKILETFPSRKFLFVGDSGEKDPEVYGALARQYPDQISHILIRDVTPDDDDEERMNQVFASVPRDKWTMFTDASEILLPTEL